MKRCAFVILITAALLGGSAAAEEPVYFADSKIKYAVECVLQTWDPTPSDMLGLTGLSCTDSGVADLTGLEYAKNLVYLDLCKNRRITSVSLLSGLVNLQHLALDNNQISDLSPLAGLTNLQWLNVHENQISDISALAGMTKLDYLNLHMNQISDISALAGMTNLTTLILNQNPISDISPLAGLMKLRCLTLYETASSLPNCPLNDEAYCTYLPQIAANNPGIQLTYGDNQTPPHGVAASDGTYPDKVHITWDRVCNGPRPDSVEPHYYIVYRSESPKRTDRNVSARLADPITSFDDTTAEPGVHYWYWVTSTINWEFGQGDEGFAQSGTGHTLTTSSTAGGTVSSPGIGSYPYGHGTSASVVATAQANYHFVNWTGTAVTAGKVVDSTSASTMVTMDADYSLQANFAIDRRTLTTSSTGGGTVSTPGIGSFQFDRGTTVSVTATASPNYHFVNWTGTAVTAGKVANANATSTTMTLDADYSLQANFAIDRRTLTTGSSAGGTVSTPGMGSYPYDRGTTVTVTATASPNYHFVNWTGTAVTAGKVANPNATSTTVTLDADYSLQANFAIDQRTLTTSSGAGGTVSTPGAGSYPYNHGATVTVTATASANYHFVNWTGTAVTAGKVANASSASTTVMMDADYNLQANFAIGQRTLTTGSSAGGTVSTPGVGSYPYDHGTTVTVTATASTNYHFVNWTGTAVTAGKVANPNAASTTVTVDSDYTLQANFAIDRRTLTTGSSAGGTVSTPGMGSYPYDRGTTVTVTATASPNYHFVNWTGSAVTAGKVANPNATSATVTLDADYSLQANFAMDQRTLTTSSGAGGTVSTPGAGSYPYNHGTTVIVTATASLNYHFVNWTGTAVTAGRVANPNAASTAVTLDADYSLQANFAKDRRTLSTSSTVGGTVSSPGIGSYAYDHGTSASVVATAQVNYRFVSWTGTAVTAGKVADATSASTQVMMDGDYTLAANFATGQAILTTSSGDGGSVTAPGEGNFSYDRGMVVPVAATADEGYHFVNWTGTAVTAGKVAGTTSASTTVMTDGDYTLVANFCADQVTLKVTSTQGGTIWQPGLGTFTYDYGTVVSLYAVAEPGYTWSGWSGGLSSVTALESLTMDGDREVRANFTRSLDVLYVDDNSPSDPGPDDSGVSDLLEDGSAAHPFDSIQEAIDVAAGEGCVVIVREGTYREQISIQNKAITVTGIDPNGAQPGSYPVIDGAGLGVVVSIVGSCPSTSDLNTALKCASAGPQSELKGFVITGGNGHSASAIACRGRSPVISNCVIVGNRSRLERSGAIYCEYSAPTLIQCTISENVAGEEGAAICGILSHVVVVNTIVWGNVPTQMTCDDISLLAVSHADIQGEWSGAGNLEADPLFALAGYWADPVHLAQAADPRESTAVWVPGDYHLKSQAGRWDRGRSVWVEDPVTSPCIDAGDPASAVGAEPQPNGGRVNLGAYGGTIQASKSGGVGG